MIKKKATKKAAKSRQSFGFVKSKGFLFTAAVMLAIAVVVGFSSFAGGTKNKGRVFSWKQGTVLQDFLIVKKAPVEQPQYVMYTEDSWKGSYLGVYTENTTPAIGSRKLRPGDSGEDVAALKKALEYIGNGKVYKSMPDYKDGQNRVFVTLNTDPKLGPFFKNLSVGDPKKFDVNMVALLEGFTDSALDTSYGSYLTAKNRELDKYEQVRLLSMATDPGTPRGTGKRVIFDWKKGYIRGNGKVYSKEEATKILGTTAVDHTNIYVGQVNRLRKGEVQSRYYPKTNYFSHTTTPQVNSRGLGKGDKGEDVKNYQAMLKFVGSKNPVAFNFTKLKVNGKWDDATIAALQQYEKFYGFDVTSGTYSRVSQQLVKDLTWPIYR